MLSEIILITEYEQSLQNFLTINRNHCYCYCYASKDIKKKTILMWNTWPIIWNEELHPLALWFKDLIMFSY